jgi:hypothetical protein
VREWGRDIVRRTRPGKGQDRARVTASLNEEVRGVRSRAEREKESQSRLGQRVRGEGSMGADNKWEREIERKRERDNGY